MVGLRTCFAKLLGVGLRVWQHGVTQVNKKPTTDTEQVSCPRCASVVDTELVHGLCPYCLLATAVADLSIGDHPAFNAPATVGRCPSIKDLNQQIDGFRFLELLGRGGSGWTFLAVQQSLGRQVAVKVSSRWSVSDQHVARFRREAESLAKLNHPAIVTVHDFGVTDSFLYFVMEYVAGPTLRDLLRTQSLGPERSVEIAKQICQGVHSVHQSGILHRDIKPENVIFDSDLPDANVKVADFGIAKLLNNVRDESSTFSGVVVGTPFYMAPEQHQVNAQLGPQSDVYAVGVVLYEMLTGQLPLGRFPKPSDLAACEPALDTAIFRALRNQFGQRTPDMLTLIDALSTSGRSATENDNKSKTLTVVLTVFATCLIIAGLLVGLISMTSTSPPNPNIQAPIQAVTKTSTPVKVEHSNSDTISDSNSDSNSNSKSSEPEVLETENPFAIQADLEGPAQNTSGTTRTPSANPIPKSVETEEENPFAPQ